MTLKDTFLLKEAISSHIWVVSYHHTSPSETIILLNFTTPQDGITDATCVITRSECPMLNHDSAIAYQFGQVFEGGNLAVLRRAGVRRYLTPVSEAVLLKIQQGAIASKFTPEKIKVLLRPIIGTS